MLLGLPEIASPRGSPFTVTTSPVFRGLRVVALQGELEAPLKHSFVIHAKLGDAVLQTPLIRARPDLTFTAHCAMSFPFSNEPGVSVFARLDGVPLTNKLAFGLVGLRGASVDRPSISVALQLVNPEGAPWGSVNLVIELTTFEQDLRATPLPRPGEDPSPLRAMPSAQYIPTPSEGGVPHQLSDLTNAPFPPLRSNIVDPLSSRRSIASNAPSQYDKIAAPTPYRGVKLIILHGASWHLRRDSDLFFVVACGARGIASNVPVKVDHDGNFVSNEIFQHMFSNDRLLHLAVFKNKKEMLGQAICDTLYLMECGVVSCKQRLTFYSRFGALEGHVEVVTEFLTEVPPPGVFRFDPSSLSPRRTLTSSPLRSSVSTLTTTTVNHEPHQLRIPVSLAYHRQQHPHDVLKEEDEAHAPDSDTSTNTRTPPADCTPRYGTFEPSPTSYLVPNGATPNLKSEILPFQTGYTTLLCAIWSVRDLPLGAKSCSATMATGQYVAAGQSVPPVEASGEAKIRKVYALPFSNQRFVELRVVVDCGLTECLRGSSWLDVEAFVQRGQTGLIEVEARNTSSNEYVGVVGLWLELTRRTTPLGATAFPSGSRWQESVLPPSSLLVVARGEATLSDGRAPTLRSRVHGHLRMPSRQASPRMSSAVARMCSASPRVSTPAGGLCGSPRAATGMAPLILGRQCSPRVADDHMVQSKVFRARYARSLPPIDSSTLEDAWLAEHLDPTSVKSIEFCIHGLRNLPDSCRCQTLRLIFFVKSLGNPQNKTGRRLAVQGSDSLSESICSKPIRISSLDPDFPNPIQLSVPFCAQEALQIDLLEISVPIKPITIGRIHWDIREALLLKSKQKSPGSISSNSSQIQKGWLKMHPSSDQSAKDLFCLYAAHFSTQPSTKAFYLDDTLVTLESSSNDQAMEWETDELVVHRRHRETYFPESAAPPTAFPSSSSVCVTVGRIDGLKSPLPFEKQSLVLALNVGGKHLRSPQVTVDKLRRVHFDARFILPVHSDETLDLHFQILSMTSVTPPTQVADGSLQLKDLWGMPHDEVAWSVPLTCVGDDMALARMSVTTEMVGRPTRGPLLVQVSSPTSGRVAGRNSVFF